LVTLANSDPSPEHVREWMEERGYEFPVLWDDRSRSEAGTWSSPETWVLDREGRMLFNFGSTPGGWGQEVGWMVESVLEGERTQGKTVGSLRRPGSY
jgi:hypothetical protein